MFSLAKSLHVLSEPHETVTASGERIMAPPLVVEVRNHQNSLAPMGGRRPKKQCATSSNTSFEIFAECRACHHMWWGTEIPLLAGSI